MISTLIIYQMILRRKRDQNQVTNEIVPKLLAIIIKTTVCGQQVGGLVLHLQDMTISLVKIWTNLKIWMIRQIRTSVIEINSQVAKIVLTKGLMIKYLKGKRRYLEPKQMLFKQRQLEVFKQLVQTLQVRLNRETNATPSPRRLIGRKNREPSQIQQLRIM